MIDTHVPVRSMGAAAFSVRGTSGAGPCSTSRWPCANAGLIDNAQIPSPNTQVATTRPRGPWELGFGSWELCVFLVKFTTPAPFVFRTVDGPDAHAVVAGRARR